MTKWKQATVNANGEIEDGDFIGGWPVVWGFYDEELPAMNSAIIEMTYNLNEAAQGDILYNSYSQPNLVKTVESKVYSRSLEGTVFIDNDKDGINNNDKLVKNAKVILYKKNGTKVAETMTDNKGHYKFDKPEAGEYDVRFESTDDVDLSKYKVTNKFAQGEDGLGEDDSKANGIDNEITGKLDKAEITQIKLPTIAEMVEKGETHSEVKYQNLGLITDKPDEVITTVMATTVEPTTVAQTTKASETTKVPETTRITETTTIQESTQKETEKQTALESTKQKQSENNGVTTTHATTTATNERQTGIYGQETNNIPVMNNDKTVNKKNSGNNTSENKSGKEKNSVSTTDSSSNSTVTTAQTGENSYIEFLILVFIVSLGGIISYLAGNKRKGASK